MENNLLCFFILVANYSFFNPSCQINVTPGRGNLRERILQKWWLNNSSYPYSWNTEGSWTSYWTFYVFIFLFFSTKTWRLGDQKKIQEHVMWNFKVFFVKKWEIIVNYWDVSGMVPNKCWARGWSCRMAVTLPNEWYRVSTSLKILKTSWNLNCII